MASARACSIPPSRLAIAAFRPFDFESEVTAGTINTIMIAMIPMTTNISSSVNPPASRSRGTTARQEPRTRSRCEAEITKQEVENLETGERKPESGERKLDSSVKAKRSRSFGNVKALRRSRCRSVKTRRVGKGDTNLSLEHTREVVKG